MGAGASATSVAQEVAALGPAYAPYAAAVTDNGVDGELLSTLHDGDARELDGALDALGVTNQLHRRKLSLAVRERGSAARHRRPARRRAARAPPAPHAVSRPRPAGVAVPSTRACELRRAERRGARRRGRARVGRRAPAESPRTPWRFELSAAAVDLDLAAALFSEDGTFLGLCYYAPGDGVARAHPLGDARGATAARAAREARRRRRGRGPCARARSAWRR